MLEVGSEVEKYVVEAEIGEGGMAQVFRVRHRTLGTLHALKVLKVQSPAIRERLVREGRVQAQFRHPNIVAVTQAESLFRGILAGVARAHRDGLIHRDLKPGNVLLEFTEDGIVPKVADFGLAKAVLEEGGRSSATRSGIAMGTPSYMSPEQLSGKKVDGRSDLFSLGVTLYQLLTGALPFQAESMATLMFKIANEAHPQPGIVRPDLPPGIGAIIDRALAKDAEQRYARGNELSRDLRALIAA